jgi:hypothetical protein
LSKYEIPTWVLKLIPPAGELIGLSDEEFLKLDSYLGEKPQYVMEIPEHPEVRERKQFNVNLKQLVALRTYNRKIREQERSVSISDLPKTAEEAEAQGYVEAKVIIALFPSTFTSSSALTKYLDSEEHKDTIRCFKPSLNRRLVHAADVLKSLFLDHEAEQVAVAKVQGDKKQRRNKPGN